MVVENVNLAVEAGGDVPENNEDWNAPPYNSDDFRMYGLKVELCQKTCEHDIANCPYAHPGERAVRRDVRVYKYEAVVCQDLLQKGKCPREDACKAAHSVFEYWLHPQRYRTQLCREGSSCTRRVCFFAHSAEELRPVTTPPDAPGPEGSGPIDPFSCGGKYSLAALNKKQQQSAAGSSNNSSSSNLADHHQDTGSTAAAQATPLPERRKSADSASAPQKRNSSNGRSRHSMDAVAPATTTAPAAAVFRSHAVTVPPPPPKKYDDMCGNAAPGACCGPMLPSPLCFNIQASGSINCRPLLPMQQQQQQQQLMPLVSSFQSDDLFAAQCDSSSLLSSGPNALSNSSIGSASITNSNCISPQLLQQLSLDSCYNVGSPVATSAMGAICNTSCPAAATVPSQQQLMLMLGQCSQAAADSTSSCSLLPKSNSGFAQQSLAGPEPLTWACDISPRLMVQQQQQQVPLRTYSPQQQQVLQVLLPAADGAVTAASSPQLAPCSPQLLTESLAGLSPSSPSSAVNAVSCSPVCQQQEQQQLMQLLLLPDAPQQQQQYLIMPQQQPQLPGRFTAQAVVMAQQANMLASQTAVLASHNSATSAPQQQMILPGSCLPLTAPLLRAGGGGGANLNRTLCAVPTPAVTTADAVSAAMLATGVQLPLRSLNPGNFNNGGLFSMPGAAAAAAYQVPMVDHQQKLQLPVLPMPQQMAPLPVTAWM